MNELQAKLMFREAVARLEDAQTLRAATNVGYDNSQSSSYLLDLLAIEILLKLIFELTLSTGPGLTHKYNLLFEKLPLQVQEEIRGLVGMRIGPSAFENSPLKVLEVWGENFVYIRYPWERYKNWSVDEYTARGDEWVEGGAKIEEATVSFYPEELVGFIHALRTVAKRLGCVE